MHGFSKAIDIICKYEGYKEKACEDSVTGSHPYTFGYGTQFYPDGSPVKAGHCVTKQKALEFLKNEIYVIDTEIDKLHLDIDSSMREALISFIHSIGWEAFLYSSVIDYIDSLKYHAAVDEMNRWIFDGNHKALGHLLHRRQEETNLFLSEIDTNVASLPNILLTAVKEYSGHPNQIQALVNLEKRMNPYILTEFMNTFAVEVKNVDIPVENDTYYELTYGDFDR